MDSGENFFGDILKYYITMDNNATNPFTPMITDVLKELSDSLTGSIEIDADPNVNVKFDS